MERRSRSRNERRVFASDPDYEELNDLASKIAIAKNPTLDFHGNQAVESGELPTLERKAIIKTLEDKMTDKLEGGVFRDFVTNIDMGE